MSDKEEFVAWLKGGSIEKQSTEGGFLVPEFINRPLPGFVALFWRLVAQFMFAVGLYGSGYLNLLKGTYKVNFHELLINRIKKGNQDG